MTARIHRDELQVWLAEVDACLSTRSESDLLAAMSREDRVHCERAIATSVRRERIVSRSLLRMGLSWYLDQAPGNWRITLTDLGRPELVADDSHLPLHFNLSHSGGLVACAFALSREVGIDTEDWSRSLPEPEVVSRYLSRSERAHWQATPPGRQREIFFRYWTLKEAYAKARGLGLTIGFDGFSVDLASDPPLLRDPSQESGRWQLSQWVRPPSHLIAVAASCEPGGAACRVVVREVSDLGLLGGERPA